MAIDSGKSLRTLDSVGGQFSPSTRTVLSGSERFFPQFASHSQRVMLVVGARLRAVISQCRNNELHNFVSRQLSLHIRRFVRGFYRTLNFSSSRLAALMACINLKRRENLKGTIWKILTKCFYV